jgi:hypothetical protein
MNRQKSIGKEKTDTKQILKNGLAVLYFLN